MLGYSNTPCNYCKNKIQHNLPEMKMPKDKTNRLQGVQMGHALANPVDINPFR